MDANGIEHPFSFTMLTRHTDEPFTGSFNITVLPGVKNIISGVTIPKYEDNCTIRFEGRKRGVLPDEGSEEVKAYRRVLQGI